MRALAIAAVLAATLGPATTAESAAPVEVDYDQGCVPEFGEILRDPGKYEYFFRRCGVPDVDQLRAALPGTPPGQMYCAPTAAVDWMVYLADRGAPEVIPGPGMRDNYLRMDQDIATMGSLMGTTPAGGTAGENAITAIQQWIDLSYDFKGGDYFRVWGYWRSGDVTVDGVRHYYRPSARELAGTTAMGSVIAPNIGWYEWRDGLMVTVGGHVVALASAHPDLWTHVGAYTLGFHDPGSDEGNNTTQGLPTVDYVPARPTLIRRPPELKPPESQLIHHLDRLILPGGQSGYLEGAYVITPKFALLPDPAEPGRRISVERALRLTEGPPDRVIESIDGEIIDFALGADGVSTTAVLDGGRLVQIENVTGTYRPVATIPGATGVVVDDLFRTAVIDGEGHITVLDRDHNNVAEIFVPGATGIAFSQPLNAFVTFDGPNRELVLLPEAIPGNPVQPRRLPLEIPDGPPIAPQAVLSVNPATGNIGLLEPGTNRLTRATVFETDGDGDQGGIFVTADAINLGDGAPLEGLVADATGAWYATREGRIVAFDAHGTESVDNPFAGRPSGPGFEIFQPMNLGEPSDGPNVLPQDAPRIGNQLTLTQAAPTESVGANHEVTVTLTDSTGITLEGRQIAYAVSGTNSLTGTATTDANGQTTIVWTSPAAGEDALTVWEDADGDNHHDADEAAGILRVTWVEPETVETNTSLAASANPAVSSRPLTLTATVTTSASGTAPTGTIQFTDDGVPLGAPVPVDTNGRAQVKVTWRDAGPNRIRADFLPAPGTPTLASSAELTVQVRCGLLDLRCILSSILSPRAL